MRRVFVRLVVAVLCVSAGAALASAQEMPRQNAPGAAHERAFAREDYEKYFAPGRLASHSPFYHSEGQMEVVSNTSSTIAGRYVLEQTTRTFDVSLNYDTSSRFKFYKIEALTTDTMMWDEQRRVWLYDYSNKEFDADRAMVWESKDDRTEISNGDSARGPLHQFYRDVDRKAGRAAKIFDRDFRREVVGFWTWGCAYVREREFDVRCNAAHETSGRTETFLFRRLDLIS